MVGRTYFKTITRMFRAEIVRFIIITLLIAIGTAIVCGIGAIAPRMRNVPISPRAEFIADRIELISFIFPVFFLLVVALVVFVTMTRLIESNRVSIGCYATLGYNRASIIFKYMLFAGAASILGVGLGFVIGEFVVSPIIYVAATAQLELPYSKRVTSTFGIIASVGIAVFVQLITLLTVYISTKEKPARLLSPKSPKIGGKILLERIPFLWNRLKFKYKSTLRNIFRYKPRFFMTVFSVLFSTALVFCGLALSFVMEQTSAHTIDFIRPISAVVVLFAVLLNVLVTYNLTNINIEERKREIATLKVLGYRHGEVAGYIFREIFILTSLGILLGLPSGYFIMDVVFNILEFGGAEYIKWYVWILTAAVSIGSLLLTDLFLYNKIRKTDMNSSLKTVE